MSSDRQEIQDGPHREHGGLIHGPGTDRRRPGIGKNARIDSALERPIWYKSNRREERRRRMEKRRRLTIVENPEVDEEGGRHMRILSTAADGSCFIPRASAMQLCGWDDLDAYTRTSPRSAGGLWWERPVQLDRLRLRVARRRHKVHERGSAYSEPIIDIRQVNNEVARSRNTHQVLFNGSVKTQVWALRTLAHGTPLRDRKMYDGINGEGVRLLPSERRTRP
ncbi:hypothetical protein C8R43DRAFT_950071 [Mycena crocata]|nr:hypothetical protein C8R43DRAFT_950071 [Mycena crocata]